jgi:RNA 2',3'-cyclic 3'-phosphodiesterase
MPEAELRLFVAIDLPAALKDKLIAIADRLRLPGYDAVRWVRPDSFHITIKFLGETPVSRIPAIEQAIAALAARQRRFDLTIGGMGFFPSGANTNHIYVGISGDLATLSSLHRAAEAAFETLGYAPENKSFKPHITLGRLRKEATREQRDEAVRRALAIHLATLGSFTTDGLRLMRSTLAPGGSIYEQVRFVPFIG